MGKGPRILWECACFLAKISALTAASIVSWGIFLFASPVFFNDADGKTLGTVLAAMILGAAGICFIFFLLDAVAGNGIAKSFLGALEFFCICPLLVLVGYLVVLAWRQYGDAKPERRPSVIVMPHGGSANESHDAIDAAETLMDSWRGR
jgi:hypothetical protein